MGWVRTHRRSAAVTALFALLLQLTLAFGHVHGVKAGEPPAAASAATGNAAGSSPPDSDHRHNDDYCAICAAMTLLSVAQAAAAPALPPRSGFAAAGLIAADAAVRVAFEHVAFRSRAPPHS
ncbi:MAG: hypothetical protein J0H89_05240 [Rhizobiales bacterium]|nr:hypothetical protein [Hyphomicrobiales bacterium]